MSKFRAKKVANFESGPREIKYRRQYSSSITTMYAAFSGDIFYNTELCTGI